MAPPTLFRQRSALKSPAIPTKRLFTATRPGPLRSSLLPAIAPRAAASSAWNSMTAQAASDCEFRFSIDRGGTFTDVFCEVSPAHAHVCAIPLVAPTFARQFEAALSARTLHTPATPLLMRKWKVFRHYVARMCTCIQTRQPAGASEPGFTYGVIPQVLTANGVVHRTTKLLSVDPSSYEDAPTEGIRRILEQETGQPHPRGQPVDTSRIASIRMGTTVRITGFLPARGMFFIV
jgi:Hydantoinase/oxoprolinase N-terminal region